MKIGVVPPDVNRSMKDFSIEELPKRGKVIRFGMGAIKGVGDGVVEGIIRDRDENGPFVHLFEFTDRTKQFGMNRSCLEALIKAGALDSIDENRAKLLAHADSAMQYADMQNRQRAVGQDSLFGEAGDSGPVNNYPILPEESPKSRTEKLAEEREVMGIYVSDHPLRGMERVLSKTATCQAAGLEELQDNSHVKLAGVIAGVRAILTKSGKRMANVVLEDFSGTASILVFPAVYEKVRDLIVKDSVVTLSGYVTIGERRGEKTVEVRLEDVKPIDPTLEFDPMSGGRKSVE